MFRYDKLFGSKELTAGDKKINEEGKKRQQIELNAFLFCLQ